MLLYRFIPKIGILSTWVCFLALLDPREAKKGKKKLNRQTPDKKNYRQKKLQIPGYFSEKKNHGCTIISHRATFVYFWRFVLSPHGTKIDTVSCRNYFCLRHFSIISRRSTGRFVLIFAKHHGQTQRISKFKVIKAIYRHIKIYTKM